MKTNVKKVGTKTYVSKAVKSPIGELRLVASEAGLAGILWPTDNPHRVKFAKVTEEKKHTALVEAEKQLAEYFAGKRKKFDIDLDFEGTDFQKKVWKALLAIPFGKTVSYAEIAKRVGSPKAVRAVGSAIGKNPISVVVACHRVIGSSGKMSGYAGGVKNKEYLIHFENKSL